MKDANNKVNCIWDTKGIWKIHLLAAQFFCKSKIILKNEIYVYKKF